MSSIRLSFAGQPLLDLERFEWRLTEGTTPYSTTFPMIKQKAEALLNIQREKAISGNPFLTLSMIDHRDTRIDFSNLYLLPPEAHPDPRFLYLTIVDNRYFWPRVNFKGAFNVRTKSGNKIVIDSTELAGLGEVPRLTTDSVIYKTFSLNPPVRDPSGDIEVRAWLLSEVILEIFNRYKIHPDTPPLTVVTSDALYAFNQVVVEDLWIDTDTASALNQIIAYTPQMGIFVDNLGKVQFYNRTGGEEALINALGVAHDTGEYYYFAKGDLACPRYIDVLFTKEIEVQLDYEETAPAKTSGSRVPEIDDAGSEKRVLFNVMQAPDPVITLTDGTKVLQGQYIRFQDTIPAWRAIADGVEVSFPEIQESWVMGNWFFAWAKLGEKDPLVDWPNRIAAIKRHYRQTYQINKNWLDKMINLQARRVSVIDAATNTYSPSPIFQDFALWFSDRGAIKTSEAEKFFYVTNIVSYPKSGLDMREVRHCSSAILSISDAELGVLDVHFMPDPMGHYSSVYPSTLVNAPTFKIGDKANPKFFDEIAPGGFNPALSPSHKMSTIITASPAPNSRNELFRFRVTPDMINNIISGLFIKIKDAKAFPYELRAPMQTLVARYAWDDKMSANIEANFGIGVANPNIDALMTNRNLIEASAKRIAAAFWLKFIDRFKGGKEGFLTKIYPRGTISQIVFSVDTNGKSGTSIRMDSNIIAPDFVNLMPSGLRAFMLQQVGSKG